jgi:transcriptional regulator with XRE-family HTH domain
MLTPEQRGKIEEFARHGVQKAEIARRLRVSRSTVDRVLAGEGTPGLEAPVYTLVMMSQILRRALSQETCSQCGATYYLPVAVPDVMCPDCGQRYRVLPENERDSSHSDEAEESADRES